MPPLTLCVAFDSLRSVSQLSPTFTEVSRFHALTAAVAVLCVLGVSPARAQSHGPPQTTTTPLVAWAGTPTHRADALLVRALRRAFPRAVLRHVEGGRPAELNFGGPPDDPDLRLFDVQARSGTAGLAAVATFRIARPPQRPSAHPEPGSHVDASCPDLWVARLSVPPGAREATIDSAALIYPNVCIGDYDDDNTGNRATVLTVAVEPEARGLEGPYRVHVTGDPLFHAQQCGCGGIAAAFEAFLRVDGGAPLVVTTHEEQATCIPTFDAWLGFTDQDHDGARDLIVRQRWATGTDHGNRVCTTSDRVATRAAVEESLDDFDSGQCVRYVERSVRLWDAAAQEYGPPQPLPLGSEAEAPLTAPRHPRELPDGGVRGRSGARPDAGVDAGSPGPAHAPALTPASSPPS